MSIELYPFRFRDPVTGRWIRARYKATIGDIARAYAEWDLTGRAEVRTPIGAHFNPYNLVANAGGEASSSAPAADRTRMNERHCILDRIATPPQLDQGRMRCPEQAAMALMPGPQHSAAMASAAKPLRPGSPPQLSVRSCHQRVSRVLSTKRDMRLDRAYAASRFSVRGVRVTLLVRLNSAANYGERTTRDIRISARVQPIHATL
jgi:hypothetical protein